MNINIQRLHDSYSYKLQELTTKLTSDIFNRLEWDVEDLYKISVKLNYLKHMIDADEIGLKSITENLLKRVIESKHIMSRSTNHMASYTSLWRKEAILDLLEELSYKLA